MKYDSNNIRKHDIANGPGIRATLFVMGCKHNCPDCFNKEYQDYNYGDEWTKEAENDFIKCVEDPQVVGVNILGGEPLDQGYPLIQLLKRIKKETGKSIWLWTGYLWENVTNEIVKDLDDLIRYQIIKEVDVLIDGPFVKSKKDLMLKYRGSSNQRVIDVQRSIRDNKLTLLEGFECQKKDKCVTNVKE